MAKFSLTLYGNSVAEILAQLAPEISGTIVSPGPVAPVAAPVPLPPAAPVAAPVQVITPPSVAPVAAPAPTFDSRGIAWDERIHAKSKAVNKDGTWRYRRNTSQDTINAIEATLPRSAAPVAAPVPLPPAAPVAAPVPLPPAAPVAAPVQVITPPSVAQLPPGQPMPQQVAAVPTTGGDDDGSSLDIPPFLRRDENNQSPATQAAPVQAAPVQAAPVQAAPVQAAPVQAAPVAQIQEITYNNVIEALSGKIKEGKIMPQSLPEFWAKIGLTGVQELQGRQDKINEAWALVHQY